MNTFARLNVFNHITKFSKNNCCIYIQLEKSNDLSKLSKITFSCFCR